MAGKNILIRYSGARKKVVIPEGVEVINDYAFHNRSDLNEVVISDSVTTIKEGAFYGCSSLKTVKMLPESAKVHFRGACGLKV